MKRLLLACSLVCASWGLQAQSLSIGGLTLSEQGFADVLLSSTGAITSNTGSVAGALTDHSLASWVQSSTPGAEVVLGFTDNRVVNGDGDDLALFEVGHEAYEYSQESFDSLWVTINGVRRLYSTTETTTSVDDHNVNMTRVDLSFFGLAAGATIDRLTIGLDYDTRGYTPQLQLVAAMHSVAAPVPEPASLALMLSGGLLLLAWRRGLVRGRGD